MHWSEKLHKELNEDTCYVKSVIVNGITHYAIHNWMGLPVSAFCDREVAFATARQYDLLPMSLH